MKTALVIPKLSQTMEEAIMGEFLVEDGELVEAGQVVANIEADKVNAELSSEVAGYIKFVCEPEDEIEVGKAFAYVYDSKEEIE